MAKLLFLGTYWLFLICQENETPFKPKEDFEVEIKFDLRQKAMADRSTIDYSETVEDQQKHTSSPLPYLIVNVKFLRFQENEVRVKAFKKDGTLLLNRKASIGMVVPIDLGFTDDLKDQVTINEYRLITYSQDKKELYLIHLKVEQDGTFKVNGEVNGKF